MNGLLKWTLDRQNIDHPLQPDEFCGGLLECQQGKKLPVVLLSTGRCFNYCVGVSCLKILQQAPTILFTACTSKSWLQPSKNWSSTPIVKYFMACYLLHTTAM